MKDILIIEDSITIATSISMILHDQGYNTVIASDAVQAIAHANRNTPDLIILDINMPAGGGYSVVQNLSQNAQTADVPIVVFTAMDTHEVNERVQQYDSIKYVVNKPDNTSLIQHINQLLAQ
ncbi:response regulator [Elusimicrobiota bacterium]